MKKLGVIIVFLCIQFNVAVAQSIEIRGRVVDFMKKPLDIFDVLVFKSDSSLLTGSTFVESHFQLNIKNSSDISYIKVQSLGYTPAFINLNVIKVDSTIDLGVIALNEESYILDEIVISKKRPMVKLSGSSYLVDISNTYLKKVGTFEDVARRIPGLVVSKNGTISVMGKPRVLINLNGRNIRNTRELQALQSDQIKSLSIDRDPSSMYASSYDAVVNITTVDAIQDYLRITVTNNSTLSRVFSNSNGMVLNGKKDRLGYFTDVSLSFDGLKQYDEETKQIWTDEQELYTDRESILTSKNKSLQLGQFFEYEFTPKSILGAGYRVTFSGIDLNKNQNFALKGASEVVIPTTVISSTQMTEHNPTLYYINRWQHSFLGVYADYYNATSKNTQDILENNKGGLNQDFRDSYEVIGLSTDFSQNLSMFSYAVGGKLSYIKDLGVYSQSIKLEQTSRLESLSFAGYFNLTKKLKKFVLLGGLRYERENSRLEMNGIEGVNASYNNLFPSFSVSYNNSPWNTSLSYSKRIYRPTYNQLKIKNVYIDPLSYSIGNPSLKPTLVDIITFSLQKGAFVGSLSFENYKDKRTQVALLEEDNGGQRVRFTYENIPSTQSLVAYLIYNYNIWKIKGASTLLLSSNHLRYKGKIYSSFDKVGLYFKTTLEAPLWKDASLMLSAVYLSPQYNDFYYNDESLNVSAYLTQGLLDNRLKISLSIGDMFKTLRANNWLQTMDQAKIRMATDADSRYVRLSLRYTFGRSTEKKKSKSAIQEELRRI